MEKLWEWLKRILRSAFEDSVKSIISSVIIAALGYGATLLWHNLFPGPPGPDGEKGTHRVERPSSPTEPITGESGPSHDTHLIIEPPAPSKPRIIELNPNEEAIGPVHKDGDTYHLALHMSGCVSLQWQSGERESSKILYTSDLYRGSITGDLMMKCDMTSTQSYKTSNPVFVSSGDYYVTVIPQTKNTVPYHMIVQSEPMESIEFEENNSFSSATLIENNKGYSASLQSRQDEDYYKFNLSEASAVNVALGTNGGGADVAVYTLTVYNENRGLLTETTAKGSSSFSETGNLYLRDGTYYVKIKHGNTWNGGAYTLTVRTSRKDMMEAESNDTLETANAIPVNKEVYASVGWEGDIDCFSFTLDKKAEVRPYFDFRRLGTDLKVYTLSLGDKDGREVASFDFRGNGEPSKEIKPVKLDAGTYTIKIARIKREEVPSILHNYTLRVSAQPTK